MAADAVGRMQAVNRKVVMAEGGVPGKKQCLEFFCRKL